MFQYPLFRIVVLSLGAREPQPRPHVSISALSDRCAQLCDEQVIVAGILVSISALSDRCAQLRWCWMNSPGIRVSISALSDRCAQRHPGGGGHDPEQFQYPLFRIVVLSLERIYRERDRMLFQYPLFRIVVLSRSA